MSDPAIDEQRQVLEPVHAGEGEPSGEIWATRLVLFLRVMAAVALVKGLYYWAIVCGVGAPSPQGFDSYAMPYQSATVFFAVIDLVAAVGLWLPGPLGGRGGMAHLGHLHGGGRGAVSADLWRSPMGHHRRAGAARRLSVARALVGT